MQSAASVTKRKGSTLSRIVPYVTPTLFVALCVLSYFYWALNATFLFENEQLTTLRDQYSEAVDLRKILDVAVKAKAKEVESMQNHISRSHSKTNKHIRDLLWQQKNMVTAETQLGMVQKTATKIEAKLKETKLISRRCLLELTIVRQHVGGNSHNVIENVKKLSYQLFDCKNNLKKTIKLPMKKMSNKNLITPFQ
ncbi:Uncharacterised protein g2407 [Pycnogonum litorale]